MPVDSLQIRDQTCSKKATLKEQNSSLRTYTYEHQEHMQQTRRRPANWLVSMMREQLASSIAETNMLTASSAWPMRETGSIPRRKTLTTCVRACVRACVLARVCVVFLSDVHRPLIENCSEEVRRYIGMPGGRVLPLLVVGRGILS